MAKCNQLTYLPFKGLTKPHSDRKHKLHAFTRRHHTHRRKSARRAWKHLL